MVAVTRTIGGVRYIDASRQWATVCTEETPVPERLREFLRLGGARFYDHDPGHYHYLRQPAVGVVGFGGFPIHFDETTPEGHVIFGKSIMTPEEIIALNREMRGLAGFHSYMNPAGKTPEEMVEITDEHGHYSNAHTTVIDLYLMGYPYAIEGTINRQRRWFNHIGCLTEARCLAQSNPPLVVMTPQGLPAAHQVRHAVAEIRGQLHKPDRGDLSAKEHRELVADHYEEFNSLWPDSKASMVMINATINNLSGCMGGIADKGQELAYRQILAMTNDTLYQLYPKLFQHSSAYGYEMPVHWPDRQEWEEQADKYKLRRLDKEQ